MGVGGQGHDPAALPPGERPGTHCTRGCVGRRLVWMDAENPAPPAGFDSWIVQPVSSRYTVTLFRPHDIVYLLSSNLERTARN